MSGKLHFFCPENDLALAFGKAAFTPPGAAVKLARSGAALPFWWAEEGDAIMCGGINEAWLSQMQEKFRLPAAQPWNHSKDYRPDPWGWSAYVKRIFEHQGYPDSRLPSDEQLAVWRELSHRRTAALLASMIPSDIPPPAEIEDAREAMEEIARLKKRAVVKSPWSSSGRGVIFAHSFAENELQRQIEGIIRRQGSVMIEKEAENVLLNFAILYHAMPTGAVHHAGYSIFETGPSGSYGNNLVGQQECITAMIESCIGAERLADITEAARDALESIIFGRYTGPVGVDMLAFGEEGITKLDSAVEMNLRRTMGFVAMSLGERIIAPESMGHLIVMKGDVSAQCTPIITENRLVSGKLALNPPGGDVTFAVEMQ